MELIITIAIIWFIFKLISGKKSSNTAQSHEGNSKRNRIFVNEHYSEERIKEASKLYRSDRVHVYRVTWTNTTTGTSMEKSYLGYDQESTAQEAHAFQKEMNDRRNYYPAKASVTYLGIQNRFNVEGLQTYAKTPFECL